MVTAIVVKLELGHTARILDIASLEGHTHEWVVFVKGADGMVIENFVEKVVFWLHESYDPPKCVVRHPPYEVKQSGYAGFNILIDIHFKNRSEPKSVRFHYDMFLHMENMPPVNHTRVEMLTFTNPADDFKKRLVKAGGELKSQDTPSQPKEKKSHKAVRLDEESKYSRSTKDKFVVSLKDEDQQKPFRSDSKSVKSHKKHEERKEKRRNSLGDGEVVKKKKSDKQNLPLHISSSEQRTKDKEKPVKIKPKSEKANQLSLFSREESIDIKQIKSKDPFKKNESRNEAEKKPEIKPKKEMKIKPEKIKKKKERKPSPEPIRSKRPQEQKQSKRRTMSSSESDSNLPMKPIHPLSDSDEERHHVEIKKRQKLEKIKLKKSIKKEKKSSNKSASKTSTEKPSQRDNTAAVDMKVIRTPPRDHSSGSQSNHHKPPVKPNTVYDKKSKSNNGTKITSTGVKIHIKDLKKREISKERDSPKPRKETPPSLSIQRSAKTKHSSKERKPSPIVRKQELKKLDSSDSDSDQEEMLDGELVEEMLDVEPEIASDKEPIKNPISPQSTSSISSNSPTANPIFTSLQPDQHDVMSHLSDDVASNSSATQTDESDVESVVFEDPHQEHHSDVAMETHDDEKSISESDHERASSPEPPAPLVTVDIGSTFNYFPEMDDEHFEFLKQLQTSLSTITDPNKVKQIASFMKENGLYSMDGNDLCFDLCALDGKTIKRLNDFQREPENFLD